MKLAEIRTSKNLSQKALGEMIGRDASTINRAEAMAQSAKLSTYLACAKALGVSLSDIFSDDLSQAEMEIIQTFRQAPPDVRERLVQLLAIVAAPLPPSAK